MYNVGGGSRATVNEMLRAVEQTLDARIRTNYVAPAEGDVRSTWANLKHIERELGYKPRTSLKEGIKAQAE